jgi:hypothetical protein
VVRAQRFTAILQAAARGRAYVPVPFDPDQVWAPKAQHHVTGTINGRGIRATIEVNDQTRGFTLGPAWVRDCHDVRIGDVVEVHIVPEGPQRDDLADDIAAALVANPRAARSLTRWPSSTAAGTCVGSRRRNAGRTNGPGGSRRWSPCSTKA